MHDWPNPDPELYAESPDASIVVEYINANS
jgi:hypothetical protein